MLFCCSTCPAELNIAPKLFFLQYKRNNRPYLLIHHAQNENPDALCLLVNMGKETVHVQCFQVVLFTRAGEEKLMTVTEYRQVSADDTNVLQVLRQGPLQPGGYLVFGGIFPCAMRVGRGDPAPVRPHNVSVIYLC